MQIVIDIPKEEYKRVMDGKWEGNDLASYIEDGTLYETVTEFADRCRECGREKVLYKIRAEIEQELYASKIAVLEIIDKYKAESEG